MTAEKNSDKLPLYGRSPDELAALCDELGMPRFAAKQLARWLYVRHEEDPLRMTDIAAVHRVALAQRFAPALSAPLRAWESVDGTKKYLYRTHRGAFIESAYIPDGDRATLCVSSQAGCRMGCKFCMTGRQGFHGSLTAAGIINQVLSIPESSSLTNIVFMGMGEPLDNIDPLLDVIAILTQPWGLAWSPRRITVSSIGKLDTLRRLLDETDVHVAISVHSPHHAQRLELMPVEKAFPVTDVFRLLRDYDFAHQRRLSAEYILWDGINDSPAHADALARLIKGTSCRVNLIRFHAIPDFPHSTAGGDAMERFRDRLNAQGVTATIRTSRGEDIEAACGMLAGKKE